jgi:hypothetical protein
LAFKSAVFHVCAIAIVAFSFRFVPRGNLCRRVYERVRNCRTKDGDEGLESRDENEEIGVRSWELGTRMSMKALSVLVFSSS